MEITWKNTMYPHTYYGHISKMQEAATDAQYPYFCWNGIIYETVKSKMTAYTSDDLDK